MAPLALPGRYRLDDNQSTDPEGVAFLATDRESGRACRIVVAAEPDAELALRRAHADRLRLAHPHLAEAIALFQLKDGRWARAEERLAPVTADSPWRSALGGWLAGLAHLHALGLVHGELTPEALGFAEDGTPKLGGPGRLWRIGQPGESPMGEAAAFAAPELMCLARVDARADLYALGAIAWTWITGEPAPRDDDALALALEALPDPGLAPLLAGLLAPTPAHRLASAAAAQALWGGDEVPLLAPPAGRVAPFVGRRPELERLLMALDEASDTLSLRVVSLVGPRGVGKTRLMEELRQRARARGLTVAVARASERTDGAPYAAFAPLVEALLARLAPSAAAALAPVFAPLVPALGVAPASELEPLAARMRLFAAVADCIEAACQPPGLLICLDDWHLADAASRELLEHLRRALPAVPLCLLLAGEEAPEGPSAGGEDARIPLGSFTRGEAAALARGLWDGGEPGGGLAATLDAGHDLTPAMVEATALACQAVATRPSAVVAIAPSLETLWRTRLLGLPQAARTLAQAAAVAGPKASLTLLEGLAGLPEQAFFGAIETLGAAGFLAPDGDGFSLLAPPEAVAAGTGLEDADEAAMHARALGHWGLAAQLGMPVPASRLALHAIGAGLSREGAHHALAAAREALDLFALPEARAFLDRAEASARRLAGEADLPDPAWRLAALVARGDLERYCACPREAEAAYREALTLAKVEAPARRAELLTSLGITFNLSARSIEAEACFRDALAEPEAPLAARSRASTSLARLALRLGRPDEARSLCREVLAQAVAAPLHEGEALGLLGLVHVNHGLDAREGLTYLHRARSLAERTGDRLALSNACMLAGNARLGLGQLAEARQSFERYALLCQELGLPDEAVCATLNLAQVAYEQGRFPEVWQRARAGTAAASAAGNRIYDAFGKAYVGLAGCHLGHLTEAEEAVRAGAELAEGVESGYVSLLVGMAQLEMAIFLGRLGTAEEIGLKLRRRQEQGGIGEFAGRLALLMGQLYALAGEVEASVGYLRQAQGLGEATGNALLVAGAQLGFGQAAFCAGQLAVARARAEEVLTLASGAVLPRLRAQMLLAQVEGALGEPALALVHLAEAERLGGALASPHWQALIWLARSRHEADGLALRQKAATYMRFYLQQLPPRARQEFLNWPERRDALSTRGTNPLGTLTHRVPAAAPPPPVSPLSHEGSRS